MSKQLAIVDDQRFDLHASPDGNHPECPERLIAAREGIRAGLGPLSAYPVDARPASPEEIARIHPSEYTHRLQPVLRSGIGHLDGDTFFNRSTEEATWLAAGGASELVKTLLTSAESGPSRGIALLRPPGHHAEPMRPMGFCILNNIAIAAATARNLGVDRVAIVDIDVHHGNGTQAAFYDDPNVLFISIHQHLLYPGTGLVEETGGQFARGSNMNIPLPAQSGPAEYAAAMRLAVLPALDHFRPSLILVSAGFDAHERDPLADMALDTQSYHALASALIARADTLCNGRIAFLLEGGYDLAAVRDSVAAVTQALGDNHIALPEDAPKSLALSTIHTATQWQPHLTYSSTQDKP